MPDCGCYRCAKEWAQREPFEARKDLGIMGQIDPRMARMFLCPTCGNKRCPRAADHRNECSGSNEPGQAGSLYENAPRPTLSGAHHD